MSYAFSFLFMTRHPEVALEAEHAGIDWIFVDTERLGKLERQSGRATIISDHSLQDISKLCTVLRTAKILARINPLHQGTKAEIDAAIDGGAAALMLPMFTTPEEVETFVSLVSGRAQAWILLETAPALVRAKEIVATPGIDRVHVGLNDLHLSLRLNFMHESVAGGMLDHVAAMIAIAPQRPKFGFGGGARLSENHPVNPKDVLREHVRLGSSAIILSRTFHKDASSADELRAQMNLDEEIRSIRDVLESAATRSAAETEQDHQRTAATIWAVARQLRRRSALTIS